MQAITSETPAGADASPTVIATPNQKPYPIATQPEAVSSSAPVRGKATNRCACSWIREHQADLPEIPEVIENVIPDDRRHIFLRVMFG